MYIIREHFFTLLIIHVCDHHSKKSRLSTLHSPVLQPCLSSQQISAIVFLLVSQCLFSCHLLRDMICSHLLIALTVTGLSFPILSTFLYLLCFSPVFAVREWNGDPVCSEASVNNTPETAGRKVLKMQL
jgi:hypothetical protein